MPTADIEVIDIRQGYVLNEFTALHIKALKNFTDAHDQVRRAGEEWLVDK
jgi:Major Vault Protein repeat domain